MEILTHGLLGAAVGLAARRGTTLPQRHGLILTVAGAMAPDLDFIGFLVSPLRFLADWHQGATHSLLLLPVWSLLAGFVYAGWSKAWRRLGEAAFLFGAGAASHVGLDLLTAYGTMVLYPVSSQRFSLDLLYVVDPLFTLAVLAGVLALWRWQLTPGLVAACMSVAGYLALAVYGQVRAFELARGGAPSAFDQVRAYPQPFSPFNWKLIASNGVDHVQTHINVLGHAPLVPSFVSPLHATARAFSTPDAIAWTSHSREPGPVGVTAAASALWMDVRLEPFRRFASHPAIDHLSTAESACVWFTDLRYDLPAMPATFRYGFCPNGTAGTWELYRLRYFSTKLERAL